jgi:hypothetical protein
MLGRVILKSLRCRPSPRDLEVLIHDEASELCRDRSPFCRSQRCWNPPWRRCQHHWYVFSTVVIVATVMLVAPVVVQESPFGRRNTS